jgi:HD-GYP domain-containing protein (c-di-GMP phosphodiesterase class II)
LASEKQTDESAGPVFGVVFASNGTFEMPDLSALPFPVKTDTVSSLDDLVLENNLIVIAGTSDITRLLSERRSSNWAAIVLTDGTDSINATVSNPRVIAVLEQKASAEAVFSAVRAAQYFLLQSSQQNAAEMLEHILEVGRALASEKELDNLLDLVLEYGRRMTGADGSSVYTRDPNGKLYLRLWQNQSTGQTSDAQKTLVGDYSIAGYVARTGETISIDDAYAIPKSAPFQFNPASDRSIGYRTVSMLTLPLKNKADEVVGVLQLINRKENYDYSLTTEEDYTTKVFPFDDASTQVALALAGQAGVALENSLLYADIENLFEGFIEASVQAIEARDPTTAGHSFRVAEFTERLGRAVDKNDSPRLRDIEFSREQLREIRYAALLHDFGKVGVREHVLVKPKKLQPHQLSLLQQRFQFAQAQLAHLAYREMLSLYDDTRLPEHERAVRRANIESQLRAETNRLNLYLETVMEANEPNISEQEVTDLLQEIANYRFHDLEDKAINLIQDFEFENLALAKGSLSPEERSEIESHVSHTYSFLSLIPWTRNLANLPNIAYAHHEKLDGSGYPRGLKQDEIPVQSKIMTISDIYDALTASDRPYKPALPAERALDILGYEAKAGKLDQDLLQVFIESNSWAPVKAGG